ncbi:Uncharacterised protein [uncultured archaeon]|nr:Uncharacterised protein [uncultured archaeon]
MILNISNLNVREIALLSHLSDEGFLERKGKNVYFVSC